MKLIMKSVLMVLRGSQLSQQLLLIWNWNMQQFTAQSLIIFLYIRNKQQISKISIWWTEAFLFPRNENKQRPANISHFITSFTLQRAYIFSAAVTDDRLGMDQNGDKRPSYLRIRGIDLWIHILFEVAVTKQNMISFVYNARTGKNDVYSYTRPRRHRSHWKDSFILQRKQKG